VPAQVETKAADVMIMKTTETNPAKIEVKFNHIERILLEHNTCCLCGSELNFSHKTDFMTLQVQEQAHCPSCRVRTRSQTYTLQ
jgi:hypothetical protein